MSKARNKFEGIYLMILICLYTAGTYVGVEVITELHEGTKGHISHQGMT